MKKKCKYILIVILLLVIGFLIALIYYKNNIKDFGESPKEIEVYNKYKLSELVNVSLAHDKEISFVDIGTKEVTFTYYQKKFKRRGVIKAKVVDKTPPLIYGSNVQYLNLNNELKIKEKYIFADNYDSEVKWKVEGEYQSDTVGNYNIKLIAEDSSNNKTIKDIKVIVRKPIRNKNRIVSNYKYNYEDALKKYKNDNTLVGLDISKWQGDVDFSKLKKRDVDFVILRLGYRKGFGKELMLDPYFEENYKKARKENIPVGVYFFSYSRNEKEAKEEGEFVLKHIKNKEIDMPIAFDWEDFKYFNDIKISLYNFNKLPDAFFSPLKHKYKDLMYLYGSTNYLHAFWNYDGNIWLADYNETTKYKGKYKMRQITERGVIDGIKGYVDINVYYKK